MPIEKTQDYDLDQMIKDLHTLENRVTKQEKERVEAAKHILELTTKLKSIKIKLKNSLRYVTVEHNKIQWESTVKTLTADIDQMILRSEDRFKFLIEPSNKKYTT